jgi:transposase-like protein
LVADAMAEDPSLTINGAVKQVGPRVGVVPDTLRSWVKQSQVDAGHLPGTTTTDAAKIKKLDAELREVKRANEILLAASSFFARELDPRLPW